MNLEGYGDDISDVVFGKKLNIHQVYPKFKAFDSQVVAEFYFILSQIYKGRNELVIARNCAEIVKQIDSTKGLVLETSIDFIEKPWLKWRMRFFMVIIVLVLLGIIGGIIWGIISLFQWIF